MTDNEVIIIVVILWLLATAFGWALSDMRRNRKIIDEQRKQILDLINKQNDTAT